MHPAQPLPSDATLGGDFARELALLIGPGYQPADGTLFAADLMTAGDALADVYTTQKNALDEAFANTANQLMAEWEFRLGIPTDESLPIADRRIAATAKRRATGGGSALRVLTAAQSIEPTATLRPNRAVDVSTTNNRAVFQWAIVIPTATWSDAHKHARITDVVEQMKPAHTVCNVTTRIGFRCDDPLSLVERDLIRI